MIQQVNDEEMKLWPILNNPSQLINLSLNSLLFAKFKHSFFNKFDVIILGKII